MSHIIHFNQDATVVFEKGLYFYIDTNKKLENKIIGVFTDVYDMDNNDLSKKKFKFLEDRTSLKGVRYLYSVKKDRAETVKSICDYFKLTVPTFSGSDQRKVIFKNDNTSIIEYNPGVSYAIFTTDENFKNYLLENKLMKNPSLTDLDGVCKPGFVLGSRRANKNNFLDELVEIAKKDVQKYEGNEINQEDQSSKGNKVFSIWGDTDFLLNNLLKLQGENNTLYTLETKTLTNGRVYYKVEVIEE